MTSTASTHSDRRPLRRREVLQLGCSSLLGLTLNDALAAGACAEVAAATNRARRIRSVILVFLPGGPSHLDTFDPKPEAPVEFRGLFQSIGTSVSGVHFCEHLPLLATRMQRLAIIRSMAHALPHHDAVSFIPCGIDAVPSGFTGSASRGDWPCYAAGLDYLRPRTDGIPSGACLPLFLKNGPLPTPGLNAGFLGPKHDPLQVDHDPNAADFRMDGLSLRSDILRGRFDARRSLLELAEQRGEQRGSSSQERQFGVYHERALEVLAKGHIADAFAIAKEPDAVRSRFGRNIYGQSLLLARRLVEAGVPMIQANLGNPTEWDTHHDNFGPMRKRLLPRLDQGLSALLDDLQDRGLLDETLILVAGEFGRTPKIGDYQDGQFWPDGRGHWSSCFSVVAAGGGTLGGQVLGASDSTAAYPTTAPYHPSDLGATIYTALGVDPASIVHDRTGRPHRLNDGSCIQALFDGAT